MRQIRERRERLPVCFAPVVTHELDQRRESPSLHQPPLVLRRLGGFALGEPPEGAARVLLRARTAEREQRHERPHASHVDNRSLRDTLVLCKVGQHASSKGLRLRALVTAEQGHERHDAPYLDNGRLVLALGPAEVPERLGRVTRRLELLRREQGDEQRHAPRARDELLPLGGGRDAREARARMQLRLALRRRDEHLDQRRRAPRPDQCLLVGGELAQVEEYLRHTSLQTGRVAPIAQQPAQGRDGSFGGDGGAVGRRSPREHRQDASRHERGRRVAHVMEERHERPDDSIPVRIARRPDVDQRVHCMSLRLLIHTAEQQHKGADRVRRGPRQGELVLGAVAHEGLESGGGPLPALLSSLREDADKRGETPRPRDAQLIVRIRREVPQGARRRIPRGGRRRRRAPRLGR